MKPLLEGKQEENNLTLHTLRRSISTTKIETINKTQWKKTVRMNMDFRETELTNVQLPQYVHRPITPREKETKR